MGISAPLNRYSSLRSVLMNHRDDRRLFGACRSRETNRLDCEFKTYCTRPRDILVSPALRLARVRSGELMPTKRDGVRHLPDSGCPSATAAFFVEFRRLLRGEKENLRSSQKTPIL